MINEKELFNELLQLDRNEKIGFLYFQKYGKCINLEQLYYIDSHKEQDIAVEQLNALDIRKLNEAFHSHYDVTHLYGLQESSFIEDGKNFTLNRLLRYCSLPERKQDFIGLVSVINGSCKATIEKKEIVLNRGDFLIIPTGTVYNLFPDNDCIALTANVRVRTFVDQFKKGFEENSGLKTFIAKALMMPFFDTAIIIHSGEDTFFKSTMLSIYYQEKNYQKLSGLINEHQWFVLIAYLIQNYEDHVDYIVSDKKNFDFLAQVYGFIGDHIQNCTLQDAADYFNVSYSYLSHKIKDISNITYAQMVRTTRLKRAASLLRKTDLKINQICEEVGYVDAAQFNRLFREEYHMTPGQYRIKANRQQDGQSLSAVEQSDI